MKVEQTQLTNMQIKQLFEEFNSKINEPGITAKYSWCMFKNCEVLAQPYNLLMSQLYDQRREPEFQKFAMENDQLIREFAKKNGDQIVFDAKNQPVLDETRMEEYAKKVQELREKYAEFFKNSDEKMKGNAELFNTPVTVMLTKLEITEIPNVAKPWVVGLIGY
jgi:hypothetical protein